MSGGRLAAEEALTRATTVIAVPDDLEPTARSTFLQTLYDRLASGQPVDQATAVARRAVSTTSGIADLAWSRPILVLTGPAAPLVVPGGGLVELGESLRQRGVAWAKGTVSGIVTSVVLFLLGLILFRLGFSPSAELSIGILSPLSLYQSFKGLVVELSTFQEHLLLLAAGGLFVATSLVGAVRWYRRRPAKPARPTVVARVVGFLTSRRTVTYLAVATLLVIGAYVYQQYLWRVVLPIGPDAMGLAVTRGASAASLREELAFSLRSEGPTQEIVVRELPVNFDVTDVDRARALGRRIDAEAVLIYREDEAAVAGAAPFVAYVVFTDPTIGLAVGTRGEIPAPVDPGLAPAPVSAAEGLPVPTLRARSVKELVGAAAGIIAYEQGRYRHAIGHLELAKPIEANAPNTGIVDFYLGLALAADHQSEAAASALERAADFYDGRQAAGLGLGSQDEFVFASTLMARGRVALDVNDLAEAIAWSERALRLREDLLAHAGGLERPIDVHATFARVYAQLARAHRLNRDGEQERRWTARAAAELEALAAAADPTDPDAAIKEGAGRFLIGDCVGADGAFRRAIALDPTAADAHINAGIIAQLSRRPAEAVDHWRRVLVLRPRDVGALELLAAQATLQGFGANYFEPAHFAAAEEIYREILRIDPANINAYVAIAGMATWQADSATFDISAFVADDARTVEKSRVAWAADPDRRQVALAAFTTAIEQRLVIATELRPGEVGAQLALAEAYHDRQTFLYWGLGDALASGDLARVLRDGTLSVADARQVLAWTAPALATDSDATRTERLRAWSLAMDALNEEWGWYYFRIYAKNISPWTSDIAIETRTELIEAEWRAASTAAVAAAEIAPPADLDEIAAMSTIYAGASLLETIFGDPTEAERYRSRMDQLASQALPAQVETNVWATAACGEEREWVEADRLRAAGDLAGARSRYEAALAINPVHIPSLTALADVDFRLGDLPRAIARAQGAAQGAPEIAGGWEILGRLRLIAGEAAAADLAYDRFFDLVARMPPQERVASLRDAIASLQEVLDADPGKRSLVRSVLPRFVAAVDAAGSGAAATYQSAQAAAEVGAFALAADDPAAAEGALRRAIELDPHLPAAHADLAIAVAIAGRPAAAEIAAAIAEANDRFWHGDPVQWALQVPGDPTWLGIAGADPAALLAEIEGRIRRYGERFPDRADRLAPLSEAIRIARERLTADGVFGTSYVGPGFGLALSWETGWSVVGADSTTSYDALRLGNGVTEVLFETAEVYARDLQACLSGAIDANRSHPGWLNFEAVVGAGGAPIAGAEAGRVFALYAFEQQVEGIGTTSFTIYLECRRLVPDEAGTLVIVVTTLGEHNRQAPLIESLLARMGSATVIAGASMPPQSSGWFPRLDDAIVAAALPGVAGTSYVGPTHGVELTWDDDWAVVAAATDGTVDALRLTNGTSFVQVDTPDSTDSPIACLRGVADELRQDEALSRVRVMADAAGQPVRGPVESMIWAVFAYDRVAAAGDPVAEALYAACRTADGLVVRVLHAVPLAEYDAQAPAREALLLRLVVPDAAAA